MENEKVIDSAEICNCVIEKLLTRPFSTLDPECQSKIVQVGRPIPSFADIPVSNPLRQFRESWYKKDSWLCGCKKTCALYCWPCLLFSTEPSPWTTRGVTDSYHATRKKHELSIDHVQCSILLYKFEKSMEKEPSAPVCSVNPCSHNKMVTTNRYILNCLIDTACFLAFQGLPYRNESESAQSTAEGNFVELLRYRAKYDEKLRNYMENSTEFVITSEDTQNDLIDSLREVFISNIKEEIKQACFVSLIFDQTTDTMNKPHLAFVLRYLTTDGVQEHFIKFVDCGDWSAPALVSCVHQLMKEMECGNKFISHTYDGCSIPVSVHTKLQELIARKYPIATYVSCYAQKQFLDLKQCLGSSIRECKVFFETLTGFAVFFSRSPKRKSKFEEAVFPRSPVRWTVPDRLVEVISDFKRDLVIFFESVISNPQSWDGETYICSRGFYATLLEFDFNFYLNIFSTVLPQAKSLFFDIQSKIGDVEFCCAAVQEFQTFLTEKRSKFHDIWKLCEDTTVPNKQPGSDGLTRRLIAHIPKENKALYWRLYLEIFDIVMKHINNRFLGVKKFEFFSLLNMSKFEDYSSKFPVRGYDSLLKLYGHYFNTPALRTELMVVYSSSEFRTSSILNLYQILSESGVRSYLPEVTKLCALHLTVFGIHFSLERSSSTTKRIQTYVRGLDFKDKFTKLPLLAIEKDHFKMLANHPYFIDSIVHNFSEKNGHIPLIYIL